MNKALVSVGQRPIIMHQLEALRSVGVKHVVVVTSPDSVTQVRDVLNRSHNFGNVMPVKVIVQDVPHGPGQALFIGARTLPDDVPVYVLMADTFLERADLMHAGDTWVGVAPAPSKRHWCYLGDRGWFEGVTDDAEVAVGVYRFGCSTVLKRSCITALNALESEALMAPILNAYGAFNPRYIKTWQDVGDVPALVRTKRAHFISRSFNHLELDDIGTLVKYGDGPDFVDEIDMLGYGKPSLWPVVYDRGEQFARMEFIDLPTLAELYLYWPGRPDMWAWIIDDLCHRLHSYLWKIPPNISTGVEHRCRAMYITKMIARFEAWDHPIKKHECLQVNGHSLQAGQPLISKLALYMRDVVLRYHRGTIHGDLNMSNVLYSLGTGTFKLVDPRGRWGGSGPEGDVRYEIAKLRYSYADHFCSITHGLFDCTAVEDEVWLQFGPYRSAETEAIDAALKLEGQTLTDIKVIEASIFLSAMPLHSEQEAVPLYIQGLKLANEVLG